MSISIRQVKAEPWPSGYGDVIATLDVAIEELAEHCNLGLYEGADNLGYYQGAAVRLPSGRRVGLLHHAGDSPNVTELHADVHDDAREATRESLQAMNLPESTVSWMRTKEHRSA